MPLIDQIYSLSNISNPNDPSNTITIDSTSNTFVVVIDTSIIPEDEPITIGDELFFIPSSELTIPAIEKIRINNSDIPLEPVSIPFEIELSVLMSGFDGDCLSSQIFPGTESATIDTNTIYSTADFSEFEMINSLHYMTIESGLFSLSIGNTLPWAVDNFVIKIKDTVEDTVWAEISLENAEESLADKKLPGLLTFETSFKITGEQINSDVSVDCNQAIYPILFSQCAEDITNSNCLLCLSGSPSDGANELCEEISTEKDCVNQILPVSLIYPDTDIALQNLFYSWNEDICNLSVAGFSIEDGAALNTEINFNVESLESITADIEFEEISNNTIDFQLGSGVSIIAAHIADKGLANIDTNRFIMTIKNDLFSNIDIDFSINEFFQINENDTVSFSQNQTVQATGNDTVLFSNFSNYTIMNENGDDVNELSFIMSISMINDSTTIDFDRDYGIDISAKLTPFELDKINVKLEEFTTPPLPVASIPAGFTDFSLPTLGFNLLFYNEINVPVGLILDLEGITGEDIMTIHVEPLIEHSGFSDVIDTTILSFIADTMFTIQNGKIIDRVKLVDIFDSARSVSIYDLFSYDELNINGRASLVGEGDLERGKSLWADIKIEINPLSLILPHNISIITQDPTPFPMLEESTASEINNTINSGELHFEVINSMPISGKINLVLTNSNYTPICFDTLATISDIGSRGLISRIEGGISDSCFNVIERELDIVQDTDSLIVYPDEYSGTHYVEIKRMSDGKLFYFGKLLEILFEEPESFTNDGIILEPSISNLNPIAIDIEKLEWLTRREDMYIVPNIVIMNSISGNNPSGYLTFQTTNYIHIKSFLTLNIDSRGVIGNDSSEEDE
jgi:hypothetical protein